MSKCCFRRPLLANKIKTPANAKSIQKSSGRNVPGTPLPLCVTGGTNGNLQISNSKRFRSYLRTAFDHSIFEIEIFLDEWAGDRFLYPVNRAVPGSPDSRHSRHPARPAPFSVFINSVYGLPSGITLGLTRGLLLRGITDH